MPVELKETVKLMKSEDWKDRFIAEYLQTKIRYERLHELIVEREVGKCPFETPIPIESWKAQASYMGSYLYELEKQAALHEILLPIFMAINPRCPVCGCFMTYYVSGSNDKIYTGHRCRCGYDTAEAKIACFNKDSV